MGANRQHVERLIGQLAPEQLEAVERLLEVMLDPLSRKLANAPIEDEDIGEDEERAVARSKEWFKHNEGTPFEQVVAELGFTLEQIRNNRLDDERDTAA